MRKINKTEILSVKYKKWVDNLNRDKMKHPPHSRTYYDDVVMNLLHCQKGVCAYTEMFLCDPRLLTEDNWENGRYKTKHPKRFGDLEHFDPGLKKERFWDWANLFVIHTDINRKKRDTEVDEILKPDSPGYDPKELLEYDDDTHIFIPHTDIEDENVKERIRRMIEVLQINHDTVRIERETFLRKAFRSCELGQSVEIDRFFTAYEMAKET